MKKLIKNIKEEVVDFFEYSVFRNIRYLKNSLVYGIKNLIKWFPIIWNDRQWDHIYFHTILRHKLFLMKEFYESDNTMTEKAEETAEYIGSVIGFIDQILEDDFASDCYESIDEKYGKIEMSFDNDDKYLNVNRPGIKTQQQKTLEREEFKKCIEQERQERNQCLDDIYKMIRNDVDNWWD